MSDKEEKVVALYGGPTGERKVNDKAVAVFEKAMEAVQSGEVIGVAIVNLHADGLASYSIGGTLGRHSMLGAMKMAKFDIIKILEA